MTLRSKVAEDPRGALFEAMEQIHVGMLGVMESGRQMQPMTHFPQPQTGEVWFITSAGTDLVRSVGLGGRAEYCVTGKSHDLYASMTGTIEQSEDRNKLKELWSPAVAMWFEGGIDDPDVCLLRLTLLEAAVWVTTDSAFKFGLELLRAGLTPGEKPDLGDHVVIRFDDAA